MPHTVHIDRDTLERLVRHAARVEPEECCGILIGHPTTDTTIINRSVEAENIADGDRTSNYQVDWATLLRVTKATRQRDAATSTAKHLHHTAAPSATTTTGPPRIVGFYHSHPNGPATPSARDRDHAWYDYAYVILAMRRGRLDTVTTWRIPPGRNHFERETILVHR